MEKIIVVLLCFTYIACKSPKEKVVIVPEKNSEIKTTLTKKVSAKTFYELKGNDLDTINKHRRDSGLPEYFLITVDTVSNITLLYYNEIKDGLILVKYDAIF